MQPESLQEAQHWLAVAELDLGSALRLLDGEPLYPGNASYLSQQAAEKALKAFLAAHGVPLEKTHNLLRLVDECREIDASFASLTSIARLLTAYVTRYRYPPFGEPLQPDVVAASEATRRARELLDFVRARLDHLASDPVEHDGKRIVRDGYDAIARAYLAARRLEPAERALLDDFVARLPTGAAVLDAGCGAGVPVAALLSERCAVTGVDVSAAQLALARERVPAARFMLADMTRLDMPAASFDGIVSLYAIIHVPRAEHAALLANFRRLLRPGGWLLFSVGGDDLDDDIQEDWLGAGAPMYWSHYGPATTRALLRAAGFEVARETPVVESEGYGGATHLFILARAAA